MMQDFKLYTDSTADLSLELTELLDVTVIPTEVFLKGERYLDYPDERELNKKDFFGAVREGEMPTTAVIPPSRFYEYFEKEVKAGNPVLYIVFSTGLTTTCQNAWIAVNELTESYPETDVAIVDSLSASLGEGALVYFAGMMKKEGKSREEIIAWLEENRQKICHWVTVDDLNHLRRGGRVSSAAAAIGGVLNIKPILTVTAEGKLEPAEKVRGRKAALDTLFKKAELTAKDPENNALFIAHADCEGDCAYLRRRLENELGAKKVYTNVMGPVIGAHTGPGAVGLLFLGTGREV